MGLFSALSGAAKVIKRQNDSDRMIKNLAGINPKDYHPDVYNRLDQVTEQIENRKIAVGGGQLNLAEFSLLRLGCLAAMSNKAEDFGSAQKFINAVGRLKRSAEEEIGLIVLYTVETDLCANLKVQDQNPEGRP